MTWFVYMLRCSDGSLYTGVTTDVERRLREHKEGKTGAKYTRGRIPLHIEYRETHKNRSDAQVREAAIKKLGKREKETLAKEARRAKRAQKKVR